MALLAALASYIGKEHANGVVVEDLREAEIEYDVGASARIQRPPSANLEDISAFGLGYGTEDHPRRWYPYWEEA